jgi:hypothetical protein
MMKKRFLGKAVPSGSKHKPARRARPIWFGLLVLPAVLASGLFAVQHHSMSPETAPRTTGNALSRSMLASQDERILGNTTRSQPTPIPVNQCQVKVNVQGIGEIGRVSEAFRRSAVRNPSVTEADADFSKLGGEAKPLYQGRVDYPDINIFPIIPDGLRGIRNDGIIDRENWCSQGFWPREVAFWFIFKALAFLNWLALAAAILLIMFGALLYITAFANEGNAKKGKSLIIGALVGLSIVFLAKVIVGIAVNIFSGETERTISTPLEP